MIDLRSDTVTLPSAEMRAAMARAELGDDVFGEDPTVNRLQELAAELMGKEAALLVSSGTMGNLVSILVHCPRGKKALIGAKSHSYMYEAGGASALGGVVLTPLSNRENGELELEELSAQLSMPTDAHFARPGLVALENTHNRCGGEAVALSHMAEAASMARRRSLPVHLDGARIFNAALALETTVQEIASHADSLSFCLSKGLACPVGSVICGSKDFIAEARRVRKMLGGGMRQAGIIAAAGIVALEKMVERLAEDHDNARALAQGFSITAGINVRPASRRTNMVFFDTDDEASRADAFAAALRERGVLFTRIAPTTFRAVTHYGIERRDVDRAISAVGEAIGEVFAG